MENPGEIGALVTRNHTADSFGARETDYQPVVEWEIGEWESQNIPSTESTFIELHLLTFWEDTRLRGIRHFGHGVLRLTCEYLHHRAQNPAQATYSTDNSFATLHSLQILRDLDDFITPAQACTVPVKQKNKAEGQEQGVSANVSLFERPLGVCLTDENPFTERRLRFE